MDCHATARGLIHRCRWDEKTQTNKINTNRLVQNLKLTCSTVDISFCQNGNFQSEKN